MTKLELEYIEDMRHEGASPREISATNTRKREGFNDMIADALEGKIEIKTAELIQFDFSGAAKF